MHRKIGESDREREVHIFLYYLHKNDSRVACMYRLSSNVYYYISLSLIYIFFLSIFYCFVFYSLSLSLDLPISVCISVYLCVRLSLSHTISVFTPIFTCSYKQMRPLILIINAKDNHTPLLTYKWCNYNYTPPNTTNIYNNNAKKT